MKSGQDAIRTWNNCIIFRQGTGFLRLSIPVAGELFWYLVGEWAGKRLPLTVEVFQQNFASYSGAQQPSVFAPRLFQPTRFSYENGNWLSRTLLFTALVVWTCSCFVLWLHGCRWGGGWARFLHFLSIKCSTPTKLGEQWSVLAGVVWNNTRSANRPAFCFRGDVFMFRPQLLPRPPPPPSAF